MAKRGDPYINIEHLAKLNHFEKSNEMGRSERGICHMIPISFRKYVFTLNFVTSSILILYTKWTMHVSLVPNIKIHHYICCTYQCTYT
jgi:hypothetical protein